MKVMMMDETEEWIQKYIQKQIGGMIFRHEGEKQFAIQKAREGAVMFLQAHQRQSRGNPGPTRRIDPYSDEGRQMWERETGDTVHNPGTQQRYFEWAKRMKEGGGGSRGNPGNPQQGAGTWLNMSDGEKTYAAHNDPRFEFDARYKFYERRRPEEISNAEYQQTHSWYQWLISRHR